MPTNGQVTLKVPKNG